MVHSSIECSSFSKLIPSRKKKIDERHLMNQENAKKNKIIIETAGTHD